MTATKELFQVTDFTRQRPLQLLQFLLLGAACQLDLFAEGITGLIQRRQRLNQGTTGCWVLLAVAFLAVLTTVLTPFFGPVFATVFSAFFHPVFTTVCPAVLTTFVDPILLAISTFTVGLFFLVVFPFCRRFFARTFSARGFAAGPVFGPNLERLAMVGSQRISYLFNFFVRSFGEAGEQDVPCIDQFSDLGKYRRTLFGDEFLESSI